MKLEKFNLEALESIPGMVLVIDQSHTLSYANSRMTSFIGVADGALAPCPIKKLFSDDSCTKLGAYLIGDNLSGGKGSDCLTVKLKDGGVSSINVDLFLMQQGDGQALLLLMSDGSYLFRFAMETEAKYRSIKSFADSLDIATWCIEYREPVDLSQSNSQIVDQVFSNDCYWTMCNRTMASLYGLPDDLDFNKQAVSTYFPRTLENEMFVQELIDNDFCVDNSLSIDKNYDGSSLYISNTVRCEIENDLLTKWWGTVVDVSEEKRSKNRLVQREAEVRNILSSIPDCIIVIDREGCIEAVNPAVYMMLGWELDSLLGKNVLSLFSRKEFLADLCELSVNDSKRIHEKLICRDGGVKNYWISASAYYDDNRNGKIVLVVRDEV